MKRACELYVEATPESREDMRRFFSSTYSLPHRLWRVSGQFADEAERSRSVRALRLAFAALSLEDGNTDWRDTYLAISELHAVATRARLNSAEIEAEVAQLSSTRLRELLLAAFRSSGMCDFA